MRSSRLTGTIPNEIAALSMHISRIFCRLVQAFSGGSRCIGGQSKVVLCLSAAIAILGASQRAHSQISSPSVADNILTPTSPIGTPPGVPTEGANESVNLSDGALTTYMPLLSVPQRGGWSLPFAFIHSSNTYYLEQDVGTTIEEDTQDGGCNGNLPNTCYYTTFTYAAHMTHGLSQPVFNINLPRLQVSEEYAGDYLWIENDGPAAMWNRYCITNFKFTDWEGNTHPFAITESCNQPNLAGAPFFPSTIGDATDGSFYRIDLSSVSTNGTAKVYSRSGTVYTFANLPQPYPTPLGMRPVRVTPAAQT